MSAISTLVLASNNQKLKELRELTAHLGFELKAQAELGVTDAIEDGLSFVENAIIKARHACAVTGLPAIADDSGIEVDYLRGQPGIYSARYAGENANDEANLQKLLQAMQSVATAERTARYQCVIVYMRHAEDPTPIIAQGEWRGVLTENKRGDGGFGYDPIFFAPEYQRTAAEISSDDKARVSHRGKALRLFEQAFREKYGSQAG